MGTLNYLNAIEGRFASQWAGRTPVAYDNAPFVAVDPPEPWVKVEVFDGSIGRASLGATYFERSVGTAFFTVYVPKNEGTAEARGLVDDIRTIFRSYQTAAGSGVITFLDSRVSRIGEAYASGAGSSISSTVSSVQWYAVTVAIAFRFDEVV
jgi:hypothetical protein